MLQEEGEEEGVGEMRFKLPASASPGAMLFLLAGCREVARAGGHSAGSAAIRLLQWQLSHAVLQAFRSVKHLWVWQVYTTHVLLTLINSLQDR